MAINKVVYGNDTLIDLTNDTVEASNLLEGETAHDRSGNPVSGTAKQGHIVQNSSGTDMTQRSKLQFADAEVSDDSTNGKTVVTVVREMTRAQFNALSQAERYGIIRITDDGNRLIDASEVTYNNETVKSKLDSLTTEVGSKTDENPTFTEAETRANIVSGETFATILGKIKKFFTDLKTVAFTGAYSDLSGTPTIPTDFVSKANGGTFSGNVTVNKQDGTASAGGSSYAILGNSTALGTAKNSKGVLRIYGKGAYYANIFDNNTNGFTANRDMLLPNKSGTFAMTSDLLKRAVKATGSLAGLTWQQGQKGMYYASLGTLSGATTLWSVCVAADSGDAYGGLKAGQIVYPFFEGLKIYLIANNISFDAAAAMQIVVLYK